MPRPSSRLARTAKRLEGLLYGSGWPVRLVRACGIRPAVKLTRLAVPLPGTKLARPLRLAYASDFHAGPTTDPHVLHAACELLRKARADVLLLGGDFITTASREVEELAVELGTIPAPLGRFAVLGNHDWWGDPRYVTDRLEASGIEVLINRNVRLATPFTGVYICGIDDHWGGSPDARAALAGADGIRVVLMHSPSGLLDLAQARFDLALCGHTHGGQLALPGGVPIVVPGGRLSRRYARGRFALGEGRTMFVSVGLGCVVVPLRLFADPEVVICELGADTPT